MNILKRYLAAALDFLLPRKCVVCGRRLNLDETHICLFCMADFPFTRFWMMDHNHMADKFNDRIQNWLNEGPITESLEPYAYALSLFFYDAEGGYRHIPYQIKYHGNISAGKFFGDMLASDIMKCEWSADVDVVVPVPLHWRRKWLRGYNQAEVIALRVAETLGVPMRKDLLKRHRYTKTQTKLNVEQKKSNVSEAFVAFPSRKSNVTHILLIDDVFTTGATLFACFKALRAVFPPDVRVSVATLGFVGEV